MAVIMFGDFVGYSTAQITRYWTGDSGSGSIASSGGRFNQAYYQRGNSGSDNIRSKSFSPISSGVIGLSVYFPTSIAAGFMSIRDGGTEHIRVVRNADGTMSITRAGTALTGGTTVTSFAENLWHWIELKFSIADSIGANSVQLYVNGVLEATVATGQDTRNGGNASINNFLLGAVSGSAHQQRFGEFYLDDGTTPLGDRRVETLFPNGNGATQDFTSSSGGHYTDVDETTADDDSTYVESSTVGHIELFDVQSMSSTPTDITAASIWSCVKKTDAGVKSCAGVLRQSSTNYTQATFYPNGDYQYDTPILLTDPATASAWTESGVNSAQIGIEVIS